MRPQDITKLGQGTELVVTGSCIFRGLRGKTVRVVRVNVPKGLIHVNDGQQAQPITLIPSDVEFPHG